MPSIEGDVLERVLARGRTLRRRRRWALRGTAALAATTCGLASLAAVSLAGTPTAHVVQVAGRPATTETTEPTAFTSPPTTQTVVPPPTPTTVATRHIVSTTTTIVCRNSSNPACGPFYWDPPPGPNQPLTVEVHYTPAAPRAGETVTFYVTATDPDARFFNTVCYLFSDNGAGPAGCGTAHNDGMTNFNPPTYDPYCGPKYGPWTPPARPGRESLGSPEGSGVTHVYSTPGTYTATFRFDSEATTCRFAGPYASHGEGTVTVVVQ